MTGEHRSAYATVNPHTGETEREFPTIGGTAVDAVVDAAHAAFEKWRSLSIEERAQLVGRAAELMEERKERLASLITTEMGKLIAESEGEVDLAAAILAYYAQNGPRFGAEQTLGVDEGEAVVVSEPLGVLVGVEP
ncbi:MAG: succinate-semialdehyde dehydrogenase / glutarate-semialdehyde dehydrogenase, partial [Streptomyces sp.]|nr:succinate-semialdehyde dehydrogenase / glutarate-semialdehyde dehydrogenase [Streptomyces sp.]